MDKEKEIIALEKKIDNDSLTSELRGMKVSELEFKLLQMAKHREAITTTMNEDDALNDAKDLVKELKAPYNEQNKQNKIKSRFIALLLEEKNLEEA